MKDLIRKILKEEISNGEVICDNCEWSWRLDDGGKDKYICHMCGHDNSPKKDIKKSNFDMVVNSFVNKFPDELKPKIDKIKDFVKFYIKKHGYTVKFLNSCSAGYHGVRTKDQIIICSPANIETIGDFIYTIFHEIRHEQQVSEIKMPNPLSDFSLDNFKKIYDQYWEMELDADQFAKNKIARLVYELGIPEDIAMKQFTLSSYIKNYPFAAKMVEYSLRQIIEYIKHMKKSGEEYEDIQDHPMVKQYLHKLEDFL